MADEVNSSSSAATVSATVSAPNSSAANIISTSFGHPLSTVLTVKLDEKNYLRMVLAILKGQKVDGYILGTKPQPSEYIEVSTESGKKLESNPLFEEWHTVDQALSGWLFGSMTPAIAADVVSFTTSREIWKALEKVYGATSKARINQLRGTLQNTKKGSMKMVEYLAIMKQASENLKLAGNSISLSDLISYVLAGLDAEYIPIVCTIEV